MEWAALPPNGREVTGRNLTAGFFISLPASTAAGTRPATMEAETMEARRATTTPAAPLTKSGLEGQEGRDGPWGLDGQAGQVGDDEFAEAVVRHHASLTRFAYMMCGNRTQAEDAVAESYARVWRRWRRGRIDNLYGYLRRAVANEIYGRHRRFLLERREAQRPPERPDDGGFETQIGDRDTLWAALGSLSPQLRVVVVLRIVEDLSEAETAAMLDIPRGTVKSRLSRALGILRAAVEGGDEADGGTGGDGGEHGRA
jgi:RNA polymerase sigma-70 factor (sigma-E family)